MRLAYITGQRPSDLLKMTEMDIYYGYLHIKQNKTSNKLCFVLGEDLLNLINEIKSYKSNIGNKIYSTNLLVNESGKIFTKIMLKYHFSKARDLANVKYNEFQFKDIRAKSATEADEIAGIEKAQNLLGHSTQSMTAHYVRNKSGKIVQPLELRNASANSKKA